MVSIDPKDKKYTIIFKRKDLRPNQRDDKLEIFRQAIGLEDVRDILDLSHFTGHHMSTPVRKTKLTVTDINSYETPFINARLNPEQVNRLRKNPNVERVEEEQIRYIDEEFVGHQIVHMDVSAAWGIPLSARGSGVNVAIIDTGIDPHIDLGTRLTINQNFGNTSGFGAADDAHHGTHVAGIAGATSGNNDGIQGVAPSCNIWNIKGISVAPPGPQEGLLIFATTDLVECIAYCNQNNAHVVNMSLSGPIGNTAEQTAINAGFTTGNTSYVAAAGNEGQTTPQPETARYPAAYPGVLAISNMNETRDNLVPSSSTGPYVDFTAPGHNIISLAENNGYRPLTGTSMSCPAAAGVVALMYSAWPGPSGCPPTVPGSPKNQTIENILQSTAIKSGLAGAGSVGTRDNKYGFGLIQARAAVAAVRGILPSALA